MTAGNDRASTGADGRPAGASTPAPLFETLGRVDSRFPVLLSVPHAGRDYPAGLRERARVDMPVLKRLEDRYADLLIADAVADGFPAIAARIARAAIDLNRDPRDIDRQMIAGMPTREAVIQSAKQRGGLGLFPRSLPRVGELWRHPLPWHEARALLEACHKGYHGAITERLDFLRARHGAAMLVDVHSMPPLAPAPGSARRPDIVIGDRFGGSVSSRYADLARSVVADHGYEAALNHPYPGYYIIERHGRPMEGRHAIQIEISRDLYLDDALDLPGPGLGKMKTMLTELISALADDMSRGSFPIAAE